MIEPGQIIQYSGASDKELLKLRRREIEERAAIAVLAALVSGSPYHDGLSGDPILQDSYVALACKCARKLALALVPEPEDSE